MDRDTKLIRDILRRGSKTAADELIRTYYDEIYIYTFRQCSNKDEAFDLTQNIFIAALGSLPSFDSKKASFRTWLYRIATNKVIDLRRRFVPVTVPIEDSDISTEDSFITNIENQELLEIVEKYVSALDPAVQEIFRLRVYGEKTFPEISSLTGQPEAKIKAVYYRLTSRLRKEFGNDY